MLFSSTAFGGALERLFSPKAELWEFWARYDNDSSLSVNHTDWNRFLQTYLISSDDGINRVAYSKVDDAAAATLGAYIKQLEQLPIRTYSQAEQLAYWINLYNAVTVKTVLAHYPVASIRDINISPGFLSFGPWDKKLLVIEQQQLSLNDIEHRILRPIWQDSRMHYALNCAAIGCPNLANRSYSVKDMDSMLNTAALAFVNHSRGASVIDGQLTISSIYSWYQSDFGCTPASGGRL